MLLSGAVTASIGHGVKEIIDAMTDQAQKVAFVYRSQFTSDPTEALAKKLCELSSNHFQWSFFVNSGTEATETAMKTAIQHFQEQGKPTKTKGFVTLDELSRYYNRSSVYVRARWKTKTLLIFA